MLKSLPQASAGAASDEKKGARSGVLEQSKMHGLFRGSGIRRAEHQQAVLKQAANTARFYDRQIAVHGVASIQQVKARPDTGQIGGLQVATFRQTHEYPSNEQDHHSG